MLYGPTVTDPLLKTCDEIQVRRNDNKYNVASVYPAWSMRVCCFTKLEQTPRACA